MTYEQWITKVVKVVETVGTGIMVIGGLGAFLAFLRDVAADARRAGSYERLRRNLGRCILLGLEVLIVADIVRTVVVDQTFQSVTVLGIIVLIRILLSFSLDVEIDGVWPWNRSGRAGTTGPGSPSPYHSPERDEVAPRSHDPANAATRRLLTSGTRATARNPRGSTPRHVHGRG